MGDADISEKCDAGPLKEQPTCQQLCPNDGETQEQFFKRLEDDASQKLETLKYAKEACENARKNPISCNSAKDMLKAKSDECNKKLGELEDAACGWATGVQTACSQSDVCYNAAVSAWKSAKKTARENSRQRKKTWKLIKHMECVTGAIGNKKVDKAKVDA